VQRATDLRIRPATGSEEDVRALRESLYEAATWRGGPGRPPLEAVLGEPAGARYVTGWPRVGDAGVIAEDASGRLLGAAWYRLFPEQDPGYGFVDETTPELAIGVRPDARGRGVGTALLEALIAQAREAGVHALSLSVEEENPATRLYERLGFVRLARAGNAWTMLLRLERPE
jgi:ribosomal protein S18 acetylase RimI-like enzyme